MNSRIVNFFRNHGAVTICFASAILFCVCLMTGYETVSRLCLGALVISSAYTGKTCPAQKSDNC